MADLKFSKMFSANFECQYMLIRKSWKLIQDHANISYHTDRAMLNVSWDMDFFLVHASIGRVFILERHLPERILDDNRRVSAHAQFQKEDAPALMTVKEILVAPGGFMPAFVFHEGHVRPQVQGHGRAADRAMRDQLAGD